MALKPMLCALVVIVALLDCVVSESIRFKKCSTGNVTKVQLTPCASQPCKFKHGQTVDVKITFVASSDEDSLKAGIKGYVGPLGLIGIPFPMPNSDGCNDQGIKCPIKKGQTYTYHSVFEVLPVYPKIRVKVGWRLDGGERNEFCFKFPMSIVDGKEFDLDTEVIG